MRCVFGPLGNEPRTFLHAMHSDEAWSKLAHEPVLNNPTRFRKHAKISWWLSVKHTESSATQTQNNWYKSSDGVIYKTKRSAERTLNDLRQRNDCREHAIEWSKCGIAWSLLHEMNADSMLFNEVKWMQRVWSLCYRNSKKTESCRWSQLTVPTRQRKLLKMLHQESQFSWRNGGCNASFGFTASINCT